MKNSIAFQTNIRSSFHFVQEDVNKIVQEQGRILRRLEGLESNQRRILFSFANAQVSNFVGSMETKEIHREDCLMIPSIKNFDKVVFSSKFEAQQQGFRECICLF